MTHRYLLLLTLCTGLAATAAAQPAQVLYEARLALAEGDARAAVERLEAVPAGAMTPEGYHVLGLAYRERLDPEQAIGALARADSMHPGVQAAIAASYDQMGRAAAALTHYRRAFALDSTHTGIALQLARLLSEAGRWNEVRTLYLRMLAAEPEHVALHARLGAAYTALDSVDAAIVHLERAHRLQTANVRTALQLSRVYLETERYVSARRVVERTIEEVPDHPRLWQRRGDLALRENDPVLADSCFRQAVALGDSSALNFHNLGVARYLQGRFEAAFEALSRSDAMDSTHVMNVFYLGVTQLQLGHYDAALASLGRTTRLAGQAVLGDVYTQIATTHDRNNHPAEAIRSFRLALDLAPDNVENLFHLARLYDAYYADSEAALRQYERFLSRVPAGERPDLQRWAARRVEAIRADRFFEAGRSPGVEAAPADSSGER